MRCRKSSGAEREALSQQAMLGLEWGPQVIQKQGTEFEFSQLTNVIGIMPF